VRIVFTTCREEVTSVKKSVRHFTVETSGKCLEMGGSPAIDLNHEVPAANQTTAAHSSRRLPALSAYAEAINDIVDLHNSSGWDSPGTVTYSMTGALRSEPLRESYGGGETLQAKYGRDEQRAGAPSLIGEERRVHCNLTVRRFAATEEMTGDTNRREKKVTIEIDV
jgi:hypothetical protein